MMTTRLRAQSISVVRDNTTIIDNVDVQLAPGEFVGLIGPNGAGKSSLLRVLAGLSDADAGQVRISNNQHADIALQQLPDRARAQLLAY